MNAGDADNLQECRTSRVGGKGPGARILKLALLFTTILVTQIRPAFPMACTRFGAVFGGSAPPAIDISTEQAPLASHSTKEDSTHWYHHCFLFLASHLIHHVSLHPASSVLSGHLSPVDLPSHGIGRNPARGVSNVTAEGRWIVQQAP